MTEEHLPQRSVGNNSQTNSYVHLPSAPNSRPLATWQEGHTSPVLCEGCNSRANRFGYPTEFKLWYEFVIAQLEAFVNHNGTDPLNEPYLDIRVPYDRMPGRFVRQVIGNFLAMQDSEQLFASYPALALLIGSDQEDLNRAHGPLDIAPLHLFMALANRSTLMTRVPFALVTTHLLDRTTAGLFVPPGSSSVGFGVAYVVSPFAFILADCSIPGIENLRIDYWTHMDVHERLTKRDLTIRVPTLSSWTGPTANMLQVVK